MVKIVNIAREEVPTTVIARMLRDLLSIVSYRAFLFFSFFFAGYDHLHLRHIAAWECRSMRVLHFREAPRGPARRESRQVDEMTGPLPQWAQSKWVQP